MKTTNQLSKKILMTVCALLLVSNVQSAEKLTDLEISRAVETELMYNATTPSFLIDALANDGIVTLSGSVDNILASDRAVKIASTVKGVRGVINKISVTAPFRSDQVIERDVRKALLSDPATDLYELTVTVENATVRLNGEVESWQEKELSAFVAKGVRGVKALENNIDITYNVNRNDLEITKDIEQSLKNDIRIDDALLTVTVKKGNVKLNGTVGSANEKSMAASLAWTAGVHSVDNTGIQVKNWARNDNFRANKYAFKSDVEIQKAVIDAFVQDPRVYSFNPSVDVVNGTVTLTGIVDNLKAKRAAKQDAKNVVGVLRVKNFLKVRPASIPEDTELEIRVANALVISPVIEKWDIDVTADNGIVYLNGSVDSYFEKTHAEDVASKTKGVVAVENNIGVQDINDYYFYDYYGWNSFYPLYHIDVKDNYQSDYEIQAEIEQELWWSPYVNQDEVEVTVVQREATLEGTVDTQREKLMAEINALEGGALEVTNNLLVEHTP